MPRHREYEVIEIRPGFFRATRDDIARFGVSKNAAVIACRVAWKAIPRAPKPKVKRVRKRVAKPVEQPPLEPGLEFVRVARARSVCADPEHSEDCGCHGFEIQRSDGTWTASMYLSAALNFCSMHKWKLVKIPRDQGRINQQLSLFDTRG